MSNFISKIKALSVKDKIQLVLAFLLTIALIATFPTYAWFNHRKQIAELQKIKTPDLLFISAAYTEDVKYFEIPSIDVADESNTKHRRIFPFAVAGEYVAEFTLQLAHTTNIPFTYKIYEADYYTTESAARAAINTKNESIADESEKLSYEYDAVEYTVKAKWTMLNQYTLSQRTLNAGDILYLVKGNQVSGGYLNSTTSGDRIIANSKYHAETYNDGTRTYDVVQTYAEPLYWQSNSIQSVPNPNIWGGNPFFKTFVIEISWDPNKVQNDKETDMLYLSAYRG